MFVDRVNLNSKYEVEEIVDFLKAKNIDYKMPDESYIVRENGEIIGTGSREGKVLKYFFMDEKYKGLGLMAKIYDRILEDLFKEGYNNYFVFTSPDKESIFTSLGLKKVEATNKVLLLEGGFSTYDTWIDHIKSKLDESSKLRGAIVMNLNPMTLGHEYLIKKALEEVDELIVFVVEEDLSIFPFENRINIIRENFKDEERIKIFGSGEYIISKTTFPTYFLKEKDNMLEEYTKLDGKIFANKICKDLNIKYRFFGEEPLDEVTASYNKNLEEILSEAGIRVKIIARKKLGEDYISASKVRELLKNGDESWKDYLVDASIEFLESEEARKIVEDLRKV